MRAALLAMKASCSYIPPAYVGGRHCREQLYASRSISNPLLGGIHRGRPGVYRDDTGIGLQGVFIRDHVSAVFG